MTEVINQVEEFEPIHAAHAIEQVAFVIQFDQEFNDQTLIKLRAVADQFKDDLPGVTEIQSIGFAFGIQIAPTQQSQVAGLVRKSVGRDGALECELRMDKTGITFVTTRYTRWNKAWEQVSKYLEALLPVYLEQANLLAIGLNYVDKFAWAGDLNNCNPALLIQKDSKYVSNHIFETKEFWHSHTGVFIRADNNTKRLLNLNVDYLDDPRPEGIKRVVSVTTTVTDQFNQQGYTPLAHEAGNKELIFSHMQSMHEFSKQVFSDLITPEMSKRIALTVG